MILSLSYDEICHLVREKSGQMIGMQYKDVDTLTLTYEASISLPVINRPITHTVAADVRLVELNLPRAVLQLDAGRMGNMALDMASKKLLEKLPAGLVEEFADGRAVLNLAAVPQLQKVLERLTVNNFSFYSTSLNLDVTLK